MDYNKYIQLFLLERISMSYFTDALSNFTTEAAYKESVRRLYDKGLSISEITENCTYPVTEEMVKKVISEYEEKKKMPPTKYVEDIDEFGRKSFRKV